MKHDGDPWVDLDSFPEPKLAADFAHQVLGKALAYRRRRRLRRRMAAICVISATLGFAATTLIRARLGQSSSTPLQHEKAVARPAREVSENLVKTSQRMARSEESSTESFTRSGSRTSSTLVIKAPVRSEPIIEGAAQETPPQIAPRTTPRRLSAQTEAASADQRTIHLP